MHGRARADRHRSDDLPEVGHIDFGSDGSYGERLDDRDFERSVVSDGDEPGYVSFHFLLERCGCILDSQQCSLRSTDSGATKRFLAIQFHGVGDRDAGAMVLRERRGILDTGAGV